MDGQLYIQYIYTHVYKEWERERAIYLYIIKVNHKAKEIFTLGWWSLYWSFFEEWKFFDSDDVI